MIFVIDTLGRLPQIGRADAWSWVFLGAGVYGLVMVYQRANAAGGIRPTWWDYVWSIFLTLVGVSGFFGLDLFWPLVLIVAALALLGKTWLPEGRDREPG